jgi:hypothetical protein
MYRLEVHFSLCVEEVLFNCSTRFRFQRFGVAHKKAHNLVTLLAAAAARGRSSCRPPASFLRHGLGLRFSSLQPALWLPVVAMR